MMKKNKEQFEKERSAYKVLSEDILVFVEKMYKLTPQRPKPEYKIKWEMIMKMEWDDWEIGKELVNAEWFGDYDPETHSYTWYDFQKGKHITWQQTLFLLSACKGATGKAKPRVSVASGHGCHAKGQGIMMYDGTIKNVEDIVVGDKIMGNDGTERIVLQLVRGREQMYRIKYHSGEYYDVNENHILALTASQTHAKQKFGDFTEISVKDYLKWSKRKQRTNVGYKAHFDFEHKELPIDPYLLGVWLGDGSTDNGIISNPDKEIHDDLLNRFPGKIISKDGDCDRIRIDGLTKLLRENNILGHKHIPHIYKTASREQRLELLAGLLDSDGTYTKKSGYEIIQKQKELADDIVFIARSLGFNATIHPKIGEIKSINFKGNYYRVHIGINLLGIPCRVLRKQAQHIENAKRKRVALGFNIEKLGVDDYYGFTISGNSLYCLEDFTVTHNCGKSSGVAILLIWFLFGRMNAQIAATAPTAVQMNDVLWKELSLWIGKLPEAVRTKFEWAKNYIRVTERPNSWFARAATSTKENPEALAGVHSDHVMAIADEASGIDDQIYHTMEGALTSGNILVVLISNPTRNIGYFYDTHHKHKNKWQTLQFSSIESPIVDPTYEEDQADLHGRDSEQYGIRVLGQFPKEDAMDLEGFLPLLSDRNIQTIPDEVDMFFPPNSILGVDPSGEGDDKAVIYIRDTLKAKKLYSQAISNDSILTEKIITLIDHYNLDPANVVIDAFGIGTNLAGKIAEATKGKYIVTSVNVGEQCDYETEKELYENKRAYMFYEGLRKWMIAGGCIVEDKESVDETKTIKYKRNLRGKIQIMGKVAMKKKYGHSSPNAADALALTFLRDIHTINMAEKLLQQQMEDKLDFNPFEAL